YELAWHLANRCEAGVHLVSHNVASALAEKRNVTWHRVPRPLNSHTLAEPLLSWKGHHIAQVLRRKSARVIVNGGNCAWPDANWVHALHAAWSCRDSEAPVGFRWRNTWHKNCARRKERQALGVARIIFANSRQVRNQLVKYLNVPPERIHVV